jgi:hypothetical protein
MQGGIAMKTDGRPFQVKTKRPVKENPMPRLPHEHDESDDSQTSGPRDDIKQAYVDVATGQVDTDLREQRGVEKTVEKPDPSLKTPVKQTGHK